MRPKLLFFIIIIIFITVIKFIFLNPEGQKQDALSSNMIYSDAGKEHQFFPQLRGQLQGKIADLYPPLPAQLLSGFLLGIDEFDKDFKAALINTGTVHVVVVSGFNVTLVASALLTSSSFLGRKKALVLSLIGIIVYTLLTGAEPPTVRAAIMGGLAFGAQALGRQKESKELLFLTASIMVILDPLLIGDLSFQLSVLATFGIIQFSPWLVSKLHRFGPLRSDLANTLAAQALVVPLIFFHFGQVSLISPLVNVLILWTVPLATILGFLSLMVSFIFFPLGQLLAWGNFVFLQVFIMVVNLFKNTPGLLLPEGNWFLVVGYYLVLAGVVNLLRRPSDSR